MFGYLSLLMFHKWTTYAADAEDFLSSERCAPSILISFIGMVLMKDNDPGEINEVTGEQCDPYMFGGDY
jgi:hypothetical protein